MVNVVNLTGMPTENQSELLKLLVEHRGYNLGCDFSINQCSFLQLDRDTNTLHIWGFDPAELTAIYTIKPYTESM